VRIDQIMTKGLVTVTMDDSVWQVQRLFEKHRFHHLPVVEHAKLVGVISDRDLLRSLSPFVGQVTERKRDRATLRRRVHQIMTREPVYVTPDTSVEDAAALLLKKGVSCMPVVDENTRPIGIVTWRDFLKALVQPTGVSSQTSEHNSDQPRA